MKSRLSTEGVEVKKNVRIKGVKVKSLHTLSKKPGFISINLLSGKHKLIVDRLKTTSWTSDAIAQPFPASRRIHLEDGNPAKEPYFKQALGRNTFKDGDGWIRCSNKIKFITACSILQMTHSVDIIESYVFVIKPSATLNDSSFKIKKMEPTTLIEVMLLLEEEPMEAEYQAKILLKIPRHDNMYSFDMKNIVPKDGLTCLVAKATSEESMLWHRRLGHVNFKNINKLVKENL
ncbi:ribonuclease H-like domain-containing protein, partial [Tanacetum coccineum]